MSKYSSNVLSFCFSYFLLLSTFSCRLHFNVIVSVGKFVDSRKSLLGDQLSTACTRQTSKTMKIAEAIRALARFLSRVHKKVRTLKLRQNINDLKRAKANERTSERKERNQTLGNISETSNTWKCWVVRNFIAMRTSYRMFTRVHFFSLFSVQHFLLFSCFSSFSIEIKWRNCSQ